MKYILVISILLASNCLSAMDSGKNEQAHELTASEKSCYEWFVKQEKTLPSYYNSLSPEDKEIFSKQVRYADNPDAVTRSRNNYVAAFYAQAKAAQIKLEYEEPVLQSALLKMTQAMHGKTIKKPTDELSARMYVFSQLLTPQEQLAWTKENYLKNTQEAESLAAKWAQLVSDELVKLNLIGGTSEAKTQKAQELYVEKTERFRKTYCPAK